MAVKMFSCHFQGIFIIDYENLISKAVMLVLLTVLPAAHDPMEDPPLSLQSARERQNLEKDLHQNTIILLSKFLLQIDIF